MSSETPSAEGEASPPTGTAATAATIPGLLATDSAPQAIAAALLAWAVTLAPAGFGRGTSATGSLLSLAALGAGVAGPIVARRRARLGRHVGISLFGGLATATWLAGESTLHPLRLDPIRGLLGAVAWGVFALAWSERWGPSAAPPNDRNAPVLLPRAALPPFATAVAFAGIAGAVVYLALAFQVRDPERALVTQAAALALGVAVVVAAGVVATLRGRPRSSSGKRLTAPAVRALLLLVTTAVAGALVIALR